MKVLVLGDSITYGHGCPDRNWYWHRTENRYVGNQDSFSKGPSDYCWASLLRQDLNVEVKNLARSGNNNINMIWEAIAELQSAETPYTHVFANFSYDDRLEFAHPSEGVSTSKSAMHTPDFLKRIDSGWDKGVELFTEKLYHPDWGVKLTHSTIYALQGLAEEYNLKYFWSVPEFNQTHGSKLLSAKCRRQQLTSIISYCKIWNPDTCDSNFGTPYVAPDGHPNEAAHAVYYNDIIRPILLK